MVLVKRTSTSSSLGSEVPLGNISPTNRSFRQRTPLESNRHFSTFSNNTSSSWSTKILILSIAVSSVLAYFAINGMHDAIKELEMAEEIQRAEFEAASQVLDEVLATRTAAEKRVDKLDREVSVLNHELRAGLEMGDAKSKTLYKAKKTVGKSKQQHDLVVEWLKDRQENLKKTTGDLQNLVQEMSRRQVISKYGDAPYRVRFSVVLATYSHEPQSFVVEMASLDDMPHSVLLFLDMVRNKLWDNSAFAHEDKAEHVLMAMPMNYHTGSYRRHHFKALGSLEVGFSEYSPRFPHEQYTLGFSGKGPEFYINTYNNTISHGPGGQEYHDLPEDADPCFGRVIDGHDVIDKMLAMTKRVSRDFKNRFSHIMKIEILPS